MIKLKQNGEIDKRTQRIVDPKTYPKRAIKYKDGTEMKRTSLNMPIEVLNKAKANHGTLAKAVEFASENIPIKKTKKNK